MPLSLLEDCRVNCDGVQGRRQVLTPLSGQQRSCAKSDSLISLEERTNVRPEPGREVSSQPLSFFNLTYVSA
jgi:hypothetical protein